MTNIDDVLEERDRLRAELVECMTQRDSLKSALSSLDRGVHRLRAEIAECQASRDRFGRSLCEAMDARVAVDLAIRECMAQRDALLVERDALRSALTDAGVTPDVDGVRELVERKRMSWLAETEQARIRADERARVADRLRRTAGNPEFVERERDPDVDSDWPLPSPLLAWADDGDGNSRRTDPP